MSTNFNLNEIILCIFFLVNYRWHVLKTPEVGSPQYYQIPYQRYGHSAVVQNDMVFKNFVNKRFCNFTQHLKILGFYLGWQK